MSTFLGVSKPNRMDIARDSLKALSAASELSESSFKTVVQAAVRVACKQETQESEETILGRC